MQTMCNAYGEVYLKNFYKLLCHGTGMCECINPTNRLYVMCMWLIDRGVDK